jgi:hypothetical protein
MSLETYVSHLITRELKRRYPRLYRIKPATVEPIGKVDSINIEGESDQGNWIGAFEDDGVTGYLYLVDPKDQQPVAACWLYNRIPAPKLSEALDYAGRGEAPPLPSDYKAAKYAPPREDLSLETIEVRWNRSGTATTVGYKDRALGIIAWNGEEWKSYAWLLDEPCKWGEPLTQEIFDQYARK